MLKKCLYCIFMMFVSATYAFSQDVAPEEVAPQESPAKQAAAAAQQATLQVLLNKAADIKLLVLDVDGVLTDGSIIYSSKGEELKVFNVKDGQGIKQLQGAGVEVAIITGRSSPMVERRAKELGINTLMQGVTDKKAALDQMMSSKGLTSDQVAFMGDDLPDLPAIQEVAFSACPIDAVPEVRAACTYVCHVIGGRGCVREVCDLIVKAKASS
jgi:3-deoxy-D-manno-octulosonate 8-phosphate phosphatase (KDO 8-P phosphatase)